MPATKSYIPTQPLPIMTSPQVLSPEARTELESPLELDASKETKFRGMGSAPTTAPVYEDPDRHHFY